jgi:hypothetical protein
VIHPLFRPDLGTNVLTSGKLIEGVATHAQWAGGPLITFGHRPVIWSKTGARVDTRILCGFSNEILNRQMFDLARTIRFPLSKRIIRSQLLEEEPFVLVDIGCSGGINAIWREFGDKLNAIGFDPNISDCERLQQAETNPHVKYVAGFVTAPPDHPFRSIYNEGRWGRNPWDRLSVSAAQAHRLATSQTPRLSGTRKEDKYADPSDEIVLADFLKSEGFEYVDFIKMDTDGDDLIILESLRGHLEGLSVSGLAVEINFFGTQSPTDHTFHNVDRLLKEKNFELFDLATRRYSVAALPSKFQYLFPAQSKTGRVWQGDALYLRDAANPEYAQDVAGWSVGRLAKLCCLFEFSRLPDCAAEIVVSFRSRFEPYIDVGGALDDLASHELKKRTSYDEYLARFRRDDPVFYKRQFIKGRPRQALAYLVRNLPLERSRRKTFL